MKTSKQILDSATRLFVPGGITSDLTPEEGAKCIRSYELAEEARQAFLNKEITFWEYIELLELHECNIDRYLNTVQSNIALMLKR